MSLMIDKLYVNILSNRLDRFRWIRPNVAVCRCPYCGDGKKGTRTRFYIYENVKYGSTGMNIDCKNCGQSGSFYNFLKGFDHGIFREYRLELFRDKFGHEPRQMFQEPEPVAEVPEDRLEKDKLEKAIKLSELPTDHTAVRYVLGRKIPVKFLDYMLYTDDFQALTADFKDDEYAKKIPDDPRLVIPFYSQFGELQCFQGRSLDPENKMRYITIKKNDSVEKTFGLDRVDWSKEVRVCEGPIDSLFVDNCLAAADADLTRVAGNVYIYDAQYRNPDVVKHINKAIEKGVKLVLFPPEFTWKDINDAVKDGGLSNNDIERIIKSNTFQGLRAKLRFNKLRGCDEVNTRTKTGNLR